jgi:hypothetical protein
MASGMVGQPRRGSYGGIQPQGPLGSMDSRRLSEVYFRRSVLVAACRDQTARSELLTMVRAYEMEDCVLGTYSYRKMAKIRCRFR